MYDTLHIIGLPWIAGQDLPSMQSVQLWRPVWSCGVTNHMLYCITINAITNNHSSHNNYSFKGAFQTAVLTIAAFQEHTNHPGSLDPLCYCTSPCAWSTCKHPCGHSHCSNYKEDPYWDQFRMHTLPTGNAPLLMHRTNTTIPTRTSTRNSICTLRDTYVCRRKWLPADMYRPSQHTNEWHCIQSSRLDPPNKKTYIAQGLAVGREGSDTATLKFKGAVCTQDTVLLYN